MAKKTRAPGGKSIWRLVLVTILVPAGILSIVGTNPAQADSQAIYRDMEPEQKQLAAITGSAPDAGDSERGLARVEIRSPEGQTVGHYAGSHALVVGVSHYTGGWPNLDAVPGEIQRVVSVLERNGFTVDPLFDPDADELRKAFESFIDSYGYSPDNRLLFFFAGHGHTRRDGARGYLVPADAPDPATDEVGFLRKALGMNQILSWARDIEAKHALFLFDSCFSGTVFKARALPDNPPHITRLTAAPVRQFITAGSAGEKVPAMSVFTPAFIDALEHGLGDLDRDGYVTGTELGLFLQREVPQHARQTPQFGKITDYELARGDYVFRLASTSPSGSSQGTISGQGANALAMDLAFWEGIKDSNNISLFRAYLKRYPNGQFRVIARARVDTLSHEASGGEGNRVTVLLSQAGDDLQALRLTSPAGNNAVEKIREVLRLEPENREARILRSRVVEHYLKLAEGAAEQDQFARARGYLRRAQTVEPDAEAIEVTRDKVDDAEAGQLRRLQSAEKRKEGEGNARQPPPTGEWRDPVTGMEFVRVPKGCFRMGSNSGDADEKPVHEVCLDGYWLGE